MASEATFTITPRRALDPAALTRDQLVLRASARSISGLGGSRRRGEGWVSVTDMVVYDNGDQSRYIDHTFRCRWVSGEPHPADGEASEARWFSVDDLPEMPPTHEERVRVALLNEPETKLGRLRPRTD